MIDGPPLEELVERVGGSTPPLLDDFGHPVYALKRFEGDRVATVERMSFENVRLTFAATGSMYYDDEWRYASVRAAVAALEAWNGQGEPLGWIRHPSTGRRRPDGDASKEYVQF